MWIKLILSYLISGKVSYTGWMLSTGFGSEFASRCSAVCTRWLLNTCLPTANPSPASLAVATCDRLTVSSRFPTCETCFVRRTFICIRRPFELELLTLETVVFLFHLLSTTWKLFSSLSTRLAHAARLGFFYKNALYKFTVITVIVVQEQVCSPNHTILNKSYHLGIMLLSFRQKCMLYAFAYSIYVTKWMLLSQYARIARKHSRP